MEDTIIAPQGVMSLDGYSYVSNAPMIYVDPTGNWKCGNHADETCVENNREYIEFLQLNNKLPGDMVIPETLPEHITDRDILVTWLYLYNSDSGRPYAELIRDSQIPVEWQDELWQGAPGSGAVNSVCTGNKCIIPEGTPIILSKPDKANPIWPVFTAAILGHEAFHYSQPYGQVRDSLYEEYKAYELQDKIYTEFSDKGWMQYNSDNGNKEVTIFQSGLIFDNSDPLIPYFLRKWFMNNLRQYLSYYESGVYTLYPSTVNPLYRTPKRVVHTRP